MKRSPYGYVPTEWVCILFLILFAFSGIGHSYQAYRYKAWWMLPTMALGCLGETIGWGGRLWSSQSPLKLNPYIIQTTATIIAPSFMSAANFTILGLIIKELGGHYSRLTPRWYVIVFVGFDLTALCIQAFGGAKSSMAVSKGKDPEPGAHIMLVGIIIQMVALTAYTVLGTEFIWRFCTDNPVRPPIFAVDDSDSEMGIVTEKSGKPFMRRNTQIMLAALVCNTIFLFIRTVYRTIELTDGWTGSIITNQNLFNTLDGVPIVLATFILNAIHPGHFLRRIPIRASQISLPRPNQMYY